jgi:predicted PurR-regulated permease PerM
LVIISLIFGSAIGGLFGMIFAVPVGALLKLMFTRFIETRLEEKQEADKEAEAKEKALIKPVKPKSEGIIK